MNPIKPLLFGCSGLTLTSDEAAFFHQAQPFGFILFQRNCDNPDQLSALTRDLRTAVGRADVPVFIDQEGGTVARLKPPHWPLLPAMRVLGRLYEKNPALGLEAARLHARLTALMLRRHGIDGNCAPVLDLLMPRASGAIGTRVFSADAAIVTAMGRVLVDTYLAHGVVPVIKHMPGHGRVQVDPHLDLPFVNTDEAQLTREDFAPFRALADAPVGMNCHVVFHALDKDAPVSMSARVHDRYLRGAIGFQGLIFSDDLAMKALSGSYEDRAVRALQAGADVALYCPGDLDNMWTIAQAVPPITDQAWARWQHAVSRRQDQPPLGDEAADRSRLDECLAQIEGA